MHFAEADKAADKPAVARPDANAKPDVDAEKTAATEAAKLAAEAKRAEARAAREAARKKEIDDASAAAAEKARKDYIERIKADPGALFADIEDETLLLRIAEARGRQLTPEAKERDAVKSEIAAIKADIQKERDAVAAERRDAERAGLERTIATILESGIEDGDIKIEPRWPYASRLTKAGVIAAPREALKIADKLAADMNRRPTPVEAAKLIEIAYDAIEAREKERAKHYAPAETTAAPRKTLNSKTPRGGGYATDNGNRGRMSKRDEILARLRNKQI
jgi:hypothetical protein